MESAQVTDIDGWHLTAENTSGDVTNITITEPDSGDYMTVSLSRTQKARLAEWLSRG